MERYDTAGLLETLPSLNIKRNNHACAKYQVRGDTEDVESLNTQHILLLQNSARQDVYLVVGGYRSETRLQLTSL